MCDFVDNISEIKTNLRADDEHYGEKGHEIAAEILRDAVIETLETIKHC